MLSQQRDLTSRVVLVAGAGSGMGRATALAAAAAGAHLVLAGRNMDALETVRASAEQHGATALAVATDATDRTAVARLVEAALSAHGKIDTLINSVGTNIARRTLAELTGASWAEMIATNLSAAFHLTQAIVPVFRRQQGGLLIHISSSAAKRPDPPASRTRRPRPASPVSLTVRWKRNASTACA